MNVYGLLLSTFSPSVDLIIFKNLLMKRIAMIDFRSKTDFAFLEYFHLVVMYCPFCILLYQLAKIL